MAINRRGFTLLELIIAIALGSLLTTIGANSMGPVWARTSVRSARDTFMSLHARGRAEAIERGQAVRTVVSATGDSAYVWSNGEVIESIDFMDKFHVDIAASQNTVIVCWTPRGYADSDCNSYASSVEIEFARSGNSKALDLWPLGKAIPR